jgi:hypothetical protein
MVRLDTSALEKATEMSEGPLWEFRKDLLVKLTDALVRESSATETNNVG